MARYPDMYWPFDFYTRLRFYFLKCANAAPNKLFVGVGDPNADHKCWERHEDMDTVRSVYYVSPSNSGSDVAGEMAAALAAASLVFQSVDPVYSKKLLENAVKGANLDDSFEDSQIGRSVLRNYWFLLSSLIFSDCPKKPGKENPLLPYNMKYPYPKFKSLVRYLVKIGVKYKAIASHE
ncbi:hypothetical protein KY284_018188 [Solanum tuberosum]|nr:hypothetical protein KY284_018188 [Solanum tuberosum]